MMPRNAAVICEIEEKLHTEDYRTETWNVWILNAWILKDLISPPNQP